MFRSVKLIREVIGSRARPSLARPIIKQNAFLGAGTFNYAPAKLNALKLSDDSLSFSVVRSATEKNTVPSRAALTLTPSAVKRIRLLLEDKPEYTGLKVGVKTRGCNGLTYTLDYTKEKHKSDEEVLQDGVRVFIDRKAQLTLLGTEMDFVETKLTSEFIFNNPNIKGVCGCRESFYV
ncbi:unnamed protein product [Tetraodon nigroviridis]|uniref:Iron-sulfur cluster assembly 1 homolog, mitochondrial n=1 Tax=Tetraodon nigroviridis TaxID=99883 RepID=Q4RSM2_TETNG|nr:unnamed protein product [Tetraodon nigroviridis]